MNAHGSPVGMLISGEVNAEGYSDFGHLTSHRWIAEWVLDPHST